MEFDTSILKPGHLKRIRSLATLNEQQLSRFLAFVSFVRCQPGEIVCREGDPANCMFLLLAGQMRILTEKKRRRPYFLRYLEPGQSFGEIALLDGGVRSATVEAVKESLLLQLDDQNFKRLLLEEPNLANQFLLRVCIGLGSHLRDLTSRAGNDAALHEVTKWVA